jgi:hypothetical protein
MDSADQMDKLHQTSYRFQRNLNGADINPHGTAGPLLQMTTVVLGDFTH